MSKNLGLLSNGSGKIGNVVLQRNNVQRARVRQIANPNTQGQAIARMIAATATRSYSSLKGIVDHSFQGIPYGGKSMNYFVKNAMRDLRNEAVKYSSGERPETLAYTFSPKYQGGIAPGELLVSKGSLPSIGGAFTVNRGGDAFFYFKINETQEISPANLAAAGVQPGDQVTFLCVDCSNAETKGVFTHVARLIINADAELTGDTFTAAMISDKTTPVLKSFLLSEGAHEMDPASIFGNNIDDVTMGVGCIILSRKEGDVWARSTEWLQWAGDTDESTVDANVYENALETWQNGGTSLGESDRYLNEGKI